jgi:hypothetical protein
MGPFSSRHVDEMNFGFVSKADETELCQSLMLCPQQLTEMMHRREPAVRAGSERRGSTHPDVASPTFFGLKELTVENSVQIEARL